MRRGKKLTYANVMSTSCLFLMVVGVGGTAAYAHGKIHSNDIAKNAVTSKHVKNGTLRPKDLKKSLRKGINDATSPWDNIPSGRTVTGRYYESSTSSHFVHTINLPARAPVALTDADVVVTGPSGNATCTGSYNDPTAPPRQGVRLQREWNRRCRAHVRRHERARPPRVLPVAFDEQLLRQLGLHRAVISTQS